MALEIFAKLDDMGDSLAEDHIFTGRKQDLTNVSKWLDEQYQNNKRKKKVLKLAEQFKSGSEKGLPIVRLNKKDSIELHQALQDLAERKNSPALKKVLGTLNNSLAVY